MINRFMMSVAAAALIAGAGFANAQGTMGKEGPSAGAPAEHGAPSNAPGAKTMAPSGMKATQSEPNAPGGMKGQRAEDNMGQKPNTNMRSETNEPKGNRNNMRSETSEPKGNREQAQGREERRGKEQAQGREDRGNMNAETKRPEEGKTVGQAGAGAKLSSDQRTKITTVIRDQHVAPATHVNFSISVGTRVPRDVSFHPLPAEVVTIYPEWRGYEFILVNDRIVVVDPRTFEIVAVLDA
jgi:hypothetical protein